MARQWRTETPNSERALLKTLDKLTRGGLGGLRHHRRLGERNQLFLVQRPPGPYQGQAQL
jgi:hypothetical protein